MLQILFMYALSTFPLTSALLYYTQPLFLLGTRMTIAGLLLLSYSALRKRFLVNRDHMWLYGQIILFAIFIPYCLRYWGLQHAPAQRAYLLYNLGPVVTYLMTIFLAIEIMNWKKSVAIVLSMIGFIFYIDAPLNAYLYPSFGLPEIALILSVICFSYGWIVIRKLITQLHYSATMVNGIAMLGGGSLGLCATALFETYPLVTDTIQFMVGLIALILISNCYVHNLYASLLKSYSLTFLQLGSLLAPLMSRSVYIALGHEQLTSAFCVSILLIITGFLIYYWQDRKQESVTTESVKA